MINTISKTLEAEEKIRYQAQSKHEDRNQAVRKIAKKRAHRGDRTLDRMLEARPDTGLVARQTGDRTQGPDAGGNRPDAGTQRPIEYRKVLERHICDRTRPVAGDRTLASVRSAHCRLNGREDRTRPVRTIQRPVSSSFTGFRPQRLLLNGAYKYNLQPAN